MIPVGTRIRTNDRPLSTILCNRSGVVVARYVPPGNLPDLNEYLIAFDATDRFPPESYYIACKFIVRD